MERPRFQSEPECRGEPLMLSQNYPGAQDAKQ
jgi:hypothetical protein